MDTSTRAEGSHSNEPPDIVQQELRFAAGGEVPVLIEVWVDLACPWC
jgi:hypothetical protein